jgi:4-amino-4-deoxy-L-arabinose transferase-like glycosyltransferase
MAQAPTDLPPEQEPDASRDTTYASQESLLARVFVQHRELWLVVALTAFGAFLRLWNLTGLPDGFHGDEANVVIDAQRIVHDGWVGAWSERALGYPIAVNYIVALSLKMLGTNVLAARLPMALLGIAAIPLMYGVIRNVAGWRAALCGTMLLIVSLWHLHLSRVGFPVIAWGTAELLALYLLQMGLRTRRWWWFLGCGLTVGVSVWVYNSAFIFAFAVGVWLAGWIVLRIVRQHDMSTVRDMMLLGILAASALFAAKPIYDYMQAPNSRYSDRFGSVYIFSNDRRIACRPVPEEKRDLRCREALTDSTLGRLNIFRHHLVALYQNLATRSAVDAADGLGAAPPLGRLALYLGVVGAIVALARYPSKPPVAIGLIVIPLLVISTAITVDGQYRRTFGIVPFVAMFGGIALGTLWEWAERRRAVVMFVAAVIVWGSIGWIGYKTLDFYFGGDFENTPNTRFVFNPDTAAAWEYLDGKGHPYVYYWNSRSSINYETRVALAPDIAGGEDRSKEFSKDRNGDPLPVRFDLQFAEAPAVPLRREPDGAVFLFMNPYTSNIETIMAKYPGGEVTAKRDERLGIYDFRAYYLPKDLWNDYLQKESVALPPIKPPR